LLGRKNDYEINVCEGCRTVYTSVTPPEAPQEAYESYYTADNLRVPEFIAARTGEILAGLSTYRQNNRMLDIGFGSGVLLEVARLQGWKAFGLEVSAPAVEQARARGFEVFHGTLEEANYPDGHFDLVTASEILEHLPDPHNFLKEVGRILRPGGTLWATTPSAGGLSFRSMRLEWSMVAPPDHAQLFSAAAVTCMLNRAGFSHIKIKTHGCRPGELIGYWRHKNKAADAAPFARDTLPDAYLLNERLTRTPTRRFIKNTLNATLNALGLGDSLKILARR